MLVEQLERLLACRILPAQTYLAGGTAVYFYLQHRLSVDLDFFTQSNFNSEIFLSKAKGCFDKVSVELIEKDTIILYLSREKIKFSLFHFPYKLLSPKYEAPLNTGITCPLASLNDIAAMKAIAIGQRGSIKDFIDLFCIIRETGLVFGDVFDLVIEKYHVDHNYDYHLKTAFVYFDDAEAEFDHIVMLKADNGQASLSRQEWEEIKSFFIGFAR